VVGVVVDATESFGSELGVTSEFVCYLFLNNLVFVLPVNILFSDYYLWFFNDSVDLFPQIIR
jgi:hypothetical protein